MGRIQLVLEDLLYEEVVKRAEKTGASKSLIVRDLLRKGLEIEEDIIPSYPNIQTTPKAYQV